MRGKDLRPVFRVASLVGVLARWLVKMAPLGCEGQGTSSRPYAVVVHNRPEGDDFKGVRRSWVGSIVCREDGQLISGPNSFRNTVSWRDLRGLVE